MRRPSLIVVLMTLMLAIFGTEVAIALYVNKPAAVPEIRIGGEFTMVNDRGQTVTDKDFAGKPMLVFFGFTSCPDICPTTLDRLSSLLDRLGSDGKKLNVLLVSVDPERDTPETLAEYLRSFHSQITGLTGTLDQLAAFAKNYKAYYRKVPAADGAYTMDHTAAVVLFDRNGKFAGALSKDEDQGNALRQLKELVDA